MNAAVALQTTTCPQCGVLFALPSHMLDEKIRIAGTVYCPSGHTATWKTTEEERLRKELEVQRAARSAAEAEVARKDRMLAAAKGQATRLRGRIANGVCPCCNRTFVKLGRHMATKHPDYKAQDIT